MEKTKEYNKYLYIFRKNSLKLLFSLIYSLFHFTPIDRNLCDSILLSDHNQKSCRF